MAPLHCWLWAERLEGGGGGAGGRFGCAVLAVPAEGGGGGGASRAARAGKRLVSASEFWSRRTPAPRAAAGACDGTGVRGLPGPLVEPRGIRKGRRWRRRAAAAAAPRGPAGTAAPGKSSSSLSSTSCGRVSDPALCRPGPARGRAPRARGCPRGRGARGRAGGAGPGGLAGRAGARGPAGGGAPGAAPKVFRSPGMSDGRGALGPAEQPTAACWHSSLRMSSRPLPAQVTHLSLHPVGGERCALLRVG